MALSAELSAAPTRDDRAQHPGIQHARVWTTMGLAVVLVLLLFHLSQPSNTPSALSSSSPSSAFVASAAEAQPSSGFKPAVPNDAAAALGARLNASVVESKELVGHSPRPAKVAVTKSALVTALRGAIWTSKHMATCIAAASQPGAPSVKIFSSGDSHGRQLVESIFKRTNPAFIPELLKKSAPFEHTVDLGRGVTIKCAQVFRRYASGFNDAKHIEPHHTTHVIFSRGAWDMLLMSTPLERLYADVLNTLIGIAASPDAPASTTFRLIHNLPRIRAVCHRACIADVEAFRRVPACAVAAFNRYVVASPSDYVTGGKGRSVKPVLLLDPKPLAEVVPFDAEGNHIGIGDSAILMDAVLRHQVCPGDGVDGLPPISELAYVTSNDTVMEERYRCAALWALLPRGGRPPLASQRKEAFEALPPPTKRAARQAELPLDRLFGLGPRYGCRCHHGDTEVNDQCALSWRAFSPASQHQNDIPYVLGTYVCRLRWLLSGQHPKGTELYRDVAAGRETNLSTVLLGSSRSSSGADSDGPLRPMEDDTAVHWLAEMMLEVCLSPDRALQVFANAGFGIQPAVPVDGQRPGGPEEPAGLCSAPDAGLHPHVLRRYGDAAVRSARPWCKTQPERFAAAVADFNALWGMYKVAAKRWNHAAISHNSAETGDPNAAARSLWGLEAPLGQCEESKLPKVMTITPYIDFAVPLVCHPNWTMGLATNSGGKAAREARWEVLNMRRRDYPKDDNVLRALYKDLRKTLGVA